MPCAAMKGATSGSSGSPLRRNILPTLPGSPPRTHQATIPSVPLGFKRAGGSLRVVRLPVRRRRFVHSVGERCRRARAGKRQIKAERPPQCEPVRRGKVMGGVGHESSFMLRGSARPEEALASRVAWRPRWKSFLPARLGRLDPTQGSRPRSRVGRVRRCGRSMAHAQPDPGRRAWGDSKAVGHAATHDPGVDVHPAADRTRVELHLGVEE